MDNDLRVLVRIKNNTLLTRREALKVNQFQMAEIIGVPVHCYIELENLKRYPVEDGEWTKHALTIAEYFDVQPEDIFPEGLSKIIKNNSSFEISSTTANLLGGTPQVKMLESSDLKEKVNEALSTLTTREAKVLAMRFGIGDEKVHTLDEIGQKMNGLKPARKDEKPDYINQSGQPFVYTDNAISKDRVRNIEAQALRKLRHPSRAKKLKEFLDGDT